MRRGDVVWVRLPRANDQPTREETGTRPAVVVQDEVAYASSPVVVVVPLTTSTAAMRFPETFLLSPSLTNGLAQPSVVLTFQVRVVDRVRVERVAGRLGPEDLARLDAGLLRLLGLGSPPSAGIAPGG